MQPRSSGKPAACRREQAPGGRQLALIDQGGHEIERGRVVARVRRQRTGKHRLGLIEAVGVTAQGTPIMLVRVRPAPLPSWVTDEERAEHQAFVATLGDKAVWKDYLSANE